MTFIEFKKDEDLTVKIHDEGKIRIIKNKANVEKLLDICKKYGYETINKNCYIKEYVPEIIRDYERFYNKKKNTIKIYNGINNLMKIKKENPHLGKGVMLAGTLVALAIINPFEKNEFQNNYPTTKTTTESNTNNDITTKEQTQLTIKTNINENKETEIEKQSLPQVHKEIDSMLENETPQFTFDYKNENLNNLNNTKKYTSIFEKYGEMYGIDPSLLEAIAAQESGGNHYDYLTNYPAVGIMQIEKSAFINKEITAYNHLENKEETILITEDKLRNLDSNIKIGAMLLQYALEASDYNIPLGIQTYNFGTGYINETLQMCESLSGIPVSEMKNNMEKTEWRYYREFLNIGDPYYVEHVLSYLDKDEITIKNRANQDITLKVVNEALKAKTI